MDLTRAASEISLVMWPAHFSVGSPLPNGVGVFLLKPTNDVVVPGWSRREEVIPRNHLCNAGDDFVLAGASDSAASIGENNIPGKKVTGAEGEASNSSAGATTTITMYTGDDEWLEELTLRASSLASIDKKQSEKGGDTNVNRREQDPGFSLLPGTEQG